MLDIGFLELLVVATLTLLILGPERLPSVLRTMGLWVGRIRRAYNNIRTEIDREIGMDEVRQQLHNEQVLAEMKAIEKDVKASKRTIQAASTKDSSHPTTHGRASSSNPISHEVASSGT